MRSLKNKWRNEWKTSGVFHQSLGFNNTIFRGSGGVLMNGWARKLFWWPIRGRVATRRIFQMSILQAVVEMQPYSNGIRRQTRGVPWSGIFWQKSCVFHQSLAFNNTILSGRGVWINKAEIKGLTTTKIWFLIARRILEKGRCQMFARETSWWQQSHGFVLRKH